MTEEHKKIIYEYINYRVSISKDRRIRSRIKSIISSFFLYLSENQLELNNFKLKECVNYRKYLIDTKKYANRTINCTIVYLNSFFKYLNKNKYIFNNPFRELKGLRREFKLPDNVLKEKEIIALLNEISKYDEEKSLINKITRYKVSVICELMYSTGMLTQEVAKLKVNNVNLDRGVVNIEYKTYYLNSYVKEILKIYIYELRDLIFDKSNRKNGSLFGASFDVVSHYVNRVLKKISIKLGFKEVTAPTFRISLGYHLFRAGCDIRYIQGLLGFKRIRAAEIFTKLEKEDLKEVIKKYHPRQLGEIKNERLELQGSETDI